MPESCRQEQERGSKAGRGPLTHITVPLGGGHVPAPRLSPADPSIPTPGDGEAERLRNSLQFSLSINAQRLAPRVGTCQSKLFLGHHSHLDQEGSHGLQASVEFGRKEEHVPCVPGAGFPRPDSPGNSLWGNLIPSHPPSLCSTTDGISESKRDKTHKWPSQDLRR